MNPENVRDILARSGARVVLPGVVDSTQDQAVCLARNGASSGTIVLAHAQTRGRGRMARHWLSPRGGMYASLISRPCLEFSAWSTVTLHVGHAIVAAVRAAGVSRAVLKWPNDCLVDNRKLCGVLVESYPAEGFMVVGIGMNVAPDRALDDAGDFGGRYRAVALADLLGRDCDDVCAAVLNSVLASLAAVDAGVTLDTVAIGDMLWSHGVVTASVDGCLVAGRVVGVDIRGRLVLETADGSVRHVSSGEVENAGCD